VDWPGVVEKAARGVVYLIRGARGSCVAVSPRLLFKVLGEPFNPIMATQFGFILKALEGLGVVSHKFHHRVSKDRGKVIYMMCREPNPMTDGHYDPTAARLLWLMAKTLHPEEAGAVLARLILEADAQSPSPQAPKPNHH
jgi:hypothetical protein